MARKFRKFFKFYFWLEKGNSELVEAQSGIFNARVCVWISNSKINFSFKIQTFTPTVIYVEEDLFTESEKSKYRL